MLDFLILVALIVGGIFIFLMWKQQKISTDTPAKGSSREDDTTTIENVGIGGVISLRGVGDKIEDHELIVQARHEYEEDGFIWHELECESGAEKFWIEIENDDELSVSLTVRKLKLGDVGLSPDQVQEIEKSDEGTITFEGRSFEYDDCGKAYFYRNSNRSSRETLRYWDFESEDELHFLTVESWGEKNYEVYYSEQLRPSQISIF